MRALQVACFILLAHGALAAATFPFFEPVQPARDFQVMAHRGLMAIAPENTAPALQRCIDAGYEWAEVDVRLTRDGHHVLFHNSTVDGKSDGTGKVKELTLAELKALDAGAWFSPEFAGEPILTLPEALALCKGKLNLYLDCKNANPALLAREILEANMEAQVVVFDSLEKLAAVRDASEGRVPTMPKWHPEFGIHDWVAKWQPAAVEINAPEITPAISAAFHALGIKVQAKVLNDDDQPEIWRKMYAAGVDWFQTDKPGEVLRVLAEGVGNSVRD